MENEVSRPSSARPSAEWMARAQAWRGDRRVAAALLACVAVAAAVAWYRAGSSSAAAPSASAVPTTVDASAAPSTIATTSTTLVSVMVDVVGAVRRNGVVQLRAGARVVDAIAAAGGATADADLVRLNLAAPVADGARIAVPRLGAPAPPVDPAAVSGAPAPAGSAGEAAGSPSPGSPVDLNTATAEQLDGLPGIGPATAAAILADRAANGPFRSVDDLGRVRGIGDAKLAQLRDLVTV